MTELSDREAHFHQLTGEAIRLWADVEGDLWWLVQAFLGVDQFRARIVIASIIGARAKREFVSRLAETYLDDKLLPDLRSLLKRMGRLSTTRNSLAHGRIFINYDGGQNFVL